MRDPEFEAMVAQLCADDPAFARRMNELASPRSTRRKVLAVVLWLIAPVCLVAGGGTGVLMAVIAVAYGVHLMWARSVFTSDGIFSTSRRRPGASL